ncbi:MAG TPA: HepT-like ribonuclease domain-containing protein [Pirellulaceae bacterium]|jgi:uncharacterized protein with HEPN domain
MTQHDPIIRIQHMRDYAMEAIQMLGGTTREELNADRKLQLALVQLIETVGEAASRVPDEVRRCHPTVPWQLAADMRNRLIHGYDVINFAIVFDTVTLNLPDLVKKLEGILPPPS